jgi:hypothetical protein
MARLKKRVFWAVVAVMCAAALIAAGRLEPDPRGHGTHAQITRGPCLFRVVTGIPCATCGMTTSFAYMVRLQVLKAFAAQPFGAVMCIGAAAAVPLALFFAVTGRGPRPRIPSEWILAPALVLLITGWIFKMLSFRSDW